MKKLGEIIHNNQPIVVALILLIAVIVYCVFNRYYAIYYNDPVHGGGTEYVVDKLTGKLFFGGTQRRSVLK